VFVCFWCLFFKGNQLTYVDVQREHKGAGETGLKIAWREEMKTISELKSFPVGARHKQKPLVADAEGREKKKKEDQ